MLSEIVWDKGTLSVVMAFAVPITVVICMAWYKVVKVKSLNNLKRAMVNRGMSAEEIKQVIAAGKSQLEDNWS